MPKINVHAEAIGTQLQWKCFINHLKSAVLKDQEKSEE